MRAGDIERYLQATDMKPAANLEASSPIITFGKSHTLIDWQGDQAGSAKAANNLTGDCALFMPQSFSGSADSTQDAVSDPADHKLITRESYTARNLVPEGVEDRWFPTIQDWQNFDEDYEPAGSERKAVPKPEKRRTGRPLTYTGDPNAPHLSEAARRKIRRRVSNRESARRIRDRRIQQTAALQAQVEQLEAQNKSLMHEAEEAKAYSTKLEGELQRVERRIAECIGETARLHEEASLLRQAVKAKMPVLEQACGKECAPMQPLGSTKQSHSSQSAAPFTPFSTVNQAAHGYDLNTSMFLLPSMDLDKITTPYFGDGCGDETNGDHPSAAVVTPASSLDLGKLSTSMLPAGF